VTTPYLAKQFVASSLSAEISGASLLTFTHNLLAGDMQPLLQKHHLENPLIDQWYSQQRVLDFLAELAQTHLPHSYSENMVAIGMKSAELVAPQFHLRQKSLDNFINAFCKVYSTRHRNVPAEEGYWPDQQGTGHYLILNNTPYPNYLVYGMFWYYTKYFCPPDQIFSVRLLPTDSRKRSFLEIKWGRGPESA
jgi:hypothetical protein